MKADALDKVKVRASEDGLLAVTDLTDDRTLASILHRLFTSLGVEFTGRWFRPPGRAADLP